MKEKEKSLVQQALEGKSDDKQGFEPRPKMVYDPETGRRLGLAHFEPVQIDILGHMTLGEKVSKILTGQMPFSADDKELEFDQEEGQWTDDDPDFDPSNDLLDKTDLHDIHKALLSEIAEKQVKESHVTQVLPVDEPPAPVEPGKAGATEKDGAKD